MQQIGRAISIAHSNPNRQQLREILSKSFITTWTEADHARSNLVARVRAACGTCRFVSSHRSRTEGRRHVNPVIVANPEIAELAKSKGARSLISWRGTR